MKRCNSRSPRSNRRRISQTFEWW